MFFFSRSTPLTSRLLELKFQLLTACTNILEIYFLLIIFAHTFQPNILPWGSEKPTEKHNGGLNMLQSSAKDNL